MSQSPKWANYVSYGVATGLGFVICKLIPNIPRLELDTKIDVVALSALLLTILVSAVFFRRFESMKHSDQLRKTAILARLESCLSNMSKLETLCEANNINYQETVRLITKCRLDFCSYVSFAVELSAQVSKQQEAEFKLLCADLKEKLTNTPPRGTAEPQLSVRNGIIHIAPDRLVEVNHDIGAAQKILWSIQRDVILSV